MMRAVRILKWSAMMGMSIFASDVQAEPLINAEQFDQVSYSVLLEETAGQCNCTCHIWTIDQNGKAHDRGLLYSSSDCNDQDGQVWTIDAPKRECSAGGLPWKIVKDVKETTEVPRNVDGKRCGRHYWVKDGTSCKEVYVPNNQVPPGLLTGCDWEYGAPKKASLPIGTVDDLVDLISEVGTFTDRAVAP